MKLSDTIIGSIIIGVLVGGAVLYVGGQQDAEQTQSVADSSNQELRFELSFDSEELANKIEAADLKGQIENVLTKLDIGSELEGVVLEALERLPEDLTINVEIEAKVNDSEKSSGDGSVR